MNVSRRAQGLFHVLMVTTGLMFLAGACTKDEEEGIVLDFTITVPDTWEEYPLSEGDFVYWAISPLNSSNDSIQEDLLVSKEMASGQNLQNYYAGVLDDLMQDESFQQLYEVDTTINGAPCKKLVHLQTLESVSPAQDTTRVEVQDMKFVFVNNNRGFVVNCAALVTTYDFYKPVYDEIMSTFTFKN